MSRTSFLVGFDPISLSLFILPIRVGSPSFSAKFPIRIGSAGLRSRRNNQCHKIPPKCPSYGSKLEAANELEPLTC